MGGELRIRWLPTIHITEVLLGCQVGIFLVQGKMGDSIIISLPAFSPLAISFNAELPPEMVSDVTLPP